MNDKSKLDSIKKAIKLFSDDYLEDGRPVQKDQVREDLDLENQKVSNESVISK